MASIELEYNRIDNKDFIMLQKTLETNMHITDIKFKKGNFVLRPTKRAIKDELEKNRKIKELNALHAITTVKDKNDAQRRVLNLQSLELSDTKFLTKLIQNIMGKVKVLHELNLSDNNLDHRAALDIANMLVENHDRGY